MSVFDVVWHRAGEQNMLEDAVIATFDTRLEALLLLHELHDGGAADVRVPPGEGFFRINSYG